MSIDIVAENTLPGTYNKSQMETAAYTGDMSVAGFARQISYNVGETAEFCVNGDSEEIEIFRVGWYGGTGFRRVETVVNTPADQSEGASISGGHGATSMTDWTVTATWDIPEDAVSGVYMAGIHNAAENDFFYATFVVRDDDAVADIIYKTSDTTWGAAYNYFGTPAAPNGKNLYGSGTGVGNIMERCVAASYHRPVITRGTVIQTYWWACELPLIRFLERNGFSVKYISSVDLDKEGYSLLAGKGSIFLSSGHDEYWTTPMRDAVETWRDVAGGHSIFMSGNEVFWRARFEHVGDESILWCYKDTMPGPTSALPRNAGDEFDPVTWTGTWRDTRWSEPRPEWFLTGTQFGMNGVYDYDVTVTKNPYGGLKQWGNTALVDNNITLVGAMGFEADHKKPTQPEGSYSFLASYTRSAPGGLADLNGQNYDVPGNIEWGIVAQRYSSGALTIGFGTCQWAWTLDATHDRGSTAVSTAAQQFTINVLNDLGAPPGSLMGGMGLQEITPLDDYGRIPGDAPEPPVTTSFFLEDGTPLEAYYKTPTGLVALEVHT